MVLPITPEEFTGQLRRAVEARKRLNLAQRLVLDPDAIDSDEIEAERESEQPPDELLSPLSDDRSIGT